jgi:coniferyl-aldehyde dehydrogenase
MIPTDSGKSEKEDGLRLIFEMQRAASRSIPAPTFERRRAALERLRDLVRTNATAIASAISADFGGRSKNETELLEIVPTLSAIRHTRRCLRSWMRPERRPVDIAFQPARAWVRYEPLGVVGIVAPWNYPLLLTITPVLDAIAAGNRAMLKPSELTPRFSELLRVIIAERYDPSEIAVITGGVEIARSFTSLPFDHLFFTGSTEVGRQVMRAAAENLTPVTLELGGKSPAIVCPDYPVEKAARSIAFGKFLNAGQTCIAPDYVLVPSERCEAFAHHVLAEATRAYPAIAGNHDYTSIIREQHRTRLNGAIDEARAAGATILSHADANANVEGKLVPTVVLNAPVDGVLLREEIFGPILPVVPYQSLDDALAFINARSRPLALYCFTHDRQRRAFVLARATSGGVTLNGTLLHIAQDALPFGGVGASGMGAYHGRDGFRRMSHARAVYQIGFINFFERLGPPWGKLAFTVARFLSRR